MRNAKAIFNKQFKSTIQSPETLIQFMIFPLVAFMMGMFVDMGSVADDLRYYNPAMADAMIANMPNLVTMMAAMFAGMALVPAVAGIIAEDKEKKSLRFLVMAGVKPSAYLIGVGSVIFFVSIFTSLAFAFIEGFSRTDFLIFTATMLSGVAASIVLGATIGIFVNSQQSATALAMPIALVLGFGPMMAQFSDTIARVLHIFYSQQINIVVDYLNGGAAAPLWQSFAIIWGNVAVLGVLFAVVYAKKGLKG